MTVTTGGTASNIRTPLLVAVQSFKTVIGDPTLLQKGQFIWDFQYKSELQKLVQQLISGNAGLTQFWNTPRPSTVVPNAPGNVFSDMMVVARPHVDDNDRRSYNKFIADALAAPAMQDGSAAAAGMTAGTADRPRISRLPGSSAAERECYPGRLNLSSRSIAARSRSTEHFASPRPHKRSAST
jgi:hypothetical protein